MEKTKKILFLLLFTFFLMNVTPALYANDDDVDVRTQTVATAAPVAAPTVQSTVVRKTVVKDDDHEGNTFRESLKADTDDELGDPDANPAKGDHVR